MAKKRKFSQEKNKNAKKKNGKKSGRFDIHSDAKKSLWGVVLIILFFMVLLSFAGLAGSAGNIFRDAAKNFLGWAMFVAPAIVLAAAYVLFNSWKRNTYLPITISAVLFLFGAAGILGLFSGEENMRGGYLGYFLSLPLERMFGPLASSIVFLGLIISSVIIGFNIKIGKIIEKRKERARALKEDVSQSGQQALKIKNGGSKQVNEGDVTVKTWNDGNDYSKDGESVGKAEKKSIASSIKSGLSKKENYKKGDEEDGFSVRDPALLASNYRLPPVELLEKETGKPSSGDIVANANIIKRTLQNFGIEVEMSEVNVGPTVTQFTLKPAEGVKLARIMALNNDLSLALAAHPIRIEAPIPGRSLVGIEIPNKGISLVRLKNLLESKDFIELKAPLPLCLGRDVSGKGIYVNLAKMPHLLIAGSTGSGKTISLNIIIMSLLYRNSPDLLKFILVDPKRVEFPVYADIPHLLAPIVVDTQKSISALKWAISEMERRFDLLSQVRARDIQSFNSNKSIIEEHGALPYIVIVIDELADLMAARGKEIEALIVRLAQMSRAVGIHLVLATQRPSVEVITGLIKANITCRIAFQVASQIDSRTILDMAGAEKLLGNGDMLFMSGEISKPKRVQGAYVTDKEIRRVTDYIREEGKKLGISEEEGALDFRGSKVAFHEENRHSNRVLDFDDADNSSSDDELYEEAMKVVIQSRKASASLLQRRLRVGYARAARLIDMLEEDGIVGPGEGAKPREIYADRADEGT